MNKTTALRDLPNVTGIIKGDGTSGFSAAIPGTDYQEPIILTTTGTSGTASLSGTTLNIPNYANNVGSSGSSGQSGATGSSGTSGTSGTSGSSGNTGAAGTSGTSGSSGNTGAGGAAGTSGTSGSSGNTGSPGAAGSSGSSGNTGAAGAAGTSGSSGNTGAAGTSGSSGNTGAAGTSGTSGSSGNTGSPGAAGSSGSSGNTGSPGAAGTSGSSGNTGAAGAVGSSGTSGQTGGTGSSGTSGLSPSAAAYVAKAGDTMTGTLTFTSSYSGDSADYTGISNPSYKITPTSGYWRVVYLSNNSTVSGVYNFQTGKNVYWGEPNDTGAYYFRGRTLYSNDNAVWHAGNLTNLNQLTNGPGYITGVTNISGYSNNLYSSDVRTISPSSHGAYRLNFGFTSWANNNSAPYADYFHLRSYSDGSGGSDNLVMFLKSGIGMRIYQQSFGSGTAYSSYVDVLHTSNYSSYSPTLTGGGASGTWGISITGNSATVGGYAAAQTYTSTGNIAGSFLGGHYSSGGTEKPNSGTFGAGKLKLAMLGNGNLGFGGPWNDVLWLSAYTGGDVKSSHALVFDKYSSNVWVSDQNFDSASWGTGYLLLSTANYSSYSLPISGGTMSGSLKVTSSNNDASSFTNVDLGSAFYTDRAGRLLTSNGTNWAADGRDPAVVISGSYSATTRGRIGLALHNETTTDNAFAPMIAFSSRSQSGGYNTVYASIMGRYTGHNTGVDTNWARGELHFYAHGNTYVDDTPTMRLTGAGFLQIASGGGSSTATLSLLQTGASNAYIQYNAGKLQIGGDSGLTDGIYFNTYNGSSYGDRVKISITGTLTVSGDIIAFGSPSDSRLKTIKSKVNNAVEKVSKLNGYYFDWKEVNNLAKIKSDVGVIAQEVAEVFPELTKTNEDGFMSVRYQGLTALLIEAIKELNQKIEAQQIIINDLLQR